MRIAAIVLAASGLLMAQHKAIHPPGVKPVGPYTPGIAAGDLIFVSGQGSRDVNGQLPGTFEGQVRQALENVKAILGAAGVGMDHVVYTQVYLTDIRQFDVMNRIYGQYFPQNAPARVVTGVSALPTAVNVEITALVVKDLSKRKVLGASDPSAGPGSTAVQVGDRILLAGMVPKGAGKANARAQVQSILSQLEATLKSAGSEMRHLAYATIYVTPNMPRKTLEDLVAELLPSEAARTVTQTASLPGGAEIAITGVASKGFRRMGRCNAVGETLYCAGRSGTTRQVLNELKADLDAGGLSMDNVVASYVQLSDINQFAAMNKVYAGFFGATPPTRTTTQPWKAVTELTLAPATGSEAKPDDSPRVEISVIAVKTAR